MQATFDILGHVLTESWFVLEASAIFLLLGFLVAAAAKVLLPDKIVAKHLGGRGPLSVLKASAMGVPLPLCSCGVLPAAASLRKQGAGRGATAAFLVSTPETGADSIAVTWALLDPVMAVVRPVAAFLTATVAGLMVNLGARREPQATGDSAPPQAKIEDEESGCGCSGSCCAQAPLAGSPWQRLRQGLTYAFGELLGDIGKWLLLGVLLAGIISALVPADFIRANFSGGIWSMLAMLVVSVPLYVCATSSTPIAAALVLKGLSPGAALVFLLAGPATNAATLSVSVKVLGRRGAFITLGAIVAVSLAMGLMVDQVYAGLGLSTEQWAQAGAEKLQGAVPFAAAVLLLLLIGWNLGRAFLRRRASLGSARDQCGCENGESPAECGLSCGCSEQPPN